jgi:osmotically-inducible protein OsmY
MKFLKLRVCAMLIAFALLTSCSSGDVRNNSADAGLAKQIQSTLFERRDLPMENVTVQVIDAVVYLYGIVDTELQRNLIEEVARDTPGIVNVVNSIGVRNSAY